MYNMYVHQPLYIYDMYGLYDIASLGFTKIVSILCNEKGNKTSNKKQNNDIHS